MDRGAWQVAVHGVAKSRTQLSDQAQTAWPINDVIVSGEQQRDSAIHAHVSILPRPPITFYLQL